MAAVVMPDRLCDSVIVDRIDMAPAGDAGDVAIVASSDAAAKTLATGIRRTVAGLRAGRISPDAGRLRATGVEWDGSFDPHVLDRSSGYERRVADAVSATLLGIEGTAEVVESIAVEAAATDVFADLVGGLPLAGGRQLDRDVQLSDPEDSAGHGCVLASGLMEPADDHATDGMADGRHARDLVLALATRHVWEGCDRIARNGRPEWAVGLADRVGRLAWATKDAYPYNPACVVAVVVADEGAADIVVEGWAWLAAEVELVMSRVWRWGGRRHGDAAELVLVGVQDAG